MNQPTAEEFDDDLVVEGLVTYWYLARRCDDECYRAARYRRPLTLLVVRITDGPDTPKVEQQLRNWMRSNVRLSDIAAYLGDRTYGLLLPETDRAGAEGLEQRLCVAFQRARTAISAHPEDGGKLETMLRTALAVMERAA